MRWVMALTGAAVLTGCARTPPPRLVVQRPHRPAASASKPAPAPAATAVKLEASSPAPTGPGANIPLEGFRPLRGWSQPGA